MIGLVPSMWDARLAVFVDTAARWRLRTPINIYRQVANTYDGVRRTSSMGSLVSKHSVDKSTVSYSIDVPLGENILPGDTIEIHGRRFVALSFEPSATYRAIGHVQVEERSMSPAQGAAE